MHLESADNCHLQATLEFVVSLEVFLNILVLLFVLHTTHQFSDCEEALLIFGSGMEQ